MAAELKQTAQALRAAVEGGALDEAARLLTKAKILITRVPLEGASAEQVGAARDALEQGVLLCVARRDLDGFRRCIAQLKPFYLDFGSAGVAESPLQWPVLGLNLMALLASNALSEFHTELELIPLEKHENEFVAFPVLLEQELMDGSYGPILSAARKVPHPGYALFMEMLVTTARDRIAACSEKAYDSLSVADIARMLSLPSEADARKFADARGWQVGGNGVVLFPDDNAAAAEIPAAAVIQQTLDYATELERIV